MSNSIGVPDERPDDSSFERALAAARPTAPELGRRLRLHGVLAAVLGVERPLPALERYALEQQIGAGGMGVVYRGRELASGRAVAVKLIDSRARFERARFEREVRVLRELASPRIVGYLDHGRTADGQDYLVMEWLDGEDLLARLRRGPLDVARALRLGIELARALATVHAAGITHRDVKPSNVILVGDRVDDVRLIDFGIAHAPTQGPRLTATGAMLGTPSYMAPEQIEGHADARTDVYGLGATLFEALTGRPVFAGEHPGAIVLAVLAEAPPSVSALRPDVPGAVDALVGRMLAKRPADRPVDMDAVAIELAQL
ncbi:MAG: serine/threonine protein kinase, partial [Deltaproteobacteria bacterium]|nr:serine/threonine protein kinase [Kofleriaceae bacterium]